MFCTLALAGEPAIKPAPAGIETTANPFTI
jgi:hypothetical protein